MKTKTLIVAFLFTLASVATASAAQFTSNGIKTASDITHSPSVISGYKTSKNVTLGTNAGVASYAANAEHLNGTRIIGTASGDPLLYMKAKVAGTAYAGVPQKSDSGEFASGWTSM